jgi:hypothetical protein
MENEQDYSLEEKAELKRFKEALSKSIIKSIDDKLEFNYLKELAEVNECSFDEKLINHCLDTYNCLIKKGKDKYTSKYLAMWKSCYQIFNEKFRKDELPI